MQQAPGAKPWEKDFQGHHLLTSSQQPLERDTGAQAGTETDPGLSPTPLPRHTFAKVNDLQATPPACV